MMNKEFDLEKSKRTGKEWAKFFRNFEKELRKKQKPMPVKFQKTIDKHFWELFLILALLLFTAPAMAADVKLAWDPVADTVTGYRVYVGPVGGEYNTTPVYEGTATTVTLTGQPNGTELKFVVRAYLNGADSVIYESANSNEVKHAVVPLPTNLRIQ